MSEYETIKFSLNETYELKLSFDEPQTFTGGQYGTSTMYGATQGTKEIRFYASAGLHEEIQKQGLKRGSMCVVQKVKPGDFPYFIVNGKSKHLERNGSSDTSSNYEATTSAIDSDALKRIKVLEDTVKDLCKKMSLDDIPF